VSESPPVDPAAALPGDHDAAPWRTWSVAERESFLDAIDRHRRAAWQVTAACAAAASLLAVLAALLLAPLLYALAVLALDVVNVLLPAPDLVPVLVPAVDALLGEASESVDPGVLRVLVLAAVPGLILMAIVQWTLYRAISTSTSLASLRLAPFGGRAPDPRLFAEQRLRNVVEEMTIAAGAPTPQVVIVPGGFNAAVVGRDSGHATVLVGDGLLNHLSRSELQGVLAHLVASIADGDMRIGLRMAATLALFGLMARMSTMLGDRESFRETLRLLTTLLFPVRAGAHEAIVHLVHPYGDGPAERQHDDTALSWREWLTLPLAGPLVVTGFLCGILSSFLLSPLVAIVWRRRKFIADATAVRLTRDPEGLSGALESISRRPAAMALTGWRSHLAVVDPGGREGLFAGGVMSPLPSLAARCQALVRLGAQPRPTDPRSELPLWTRMLLAGAWSLAGVLGLTLVPLLVVLSFMLSGLFTLLPAAALHALLRWLGH
jgi:Zn-dependent protease with chaperone function